MKFSLEKIQIIVEPFAFDRRGLGFLTNLERFLPLGFSVSFSTIQTYSAVQTPKHFLENCKQTRFPHWFWQGQVS